MSQGWRFIKLTALVPLLAGLVGCAGDLSNSSQTAPSAGTVSSESAMASAPVVGSPAPPSSPMASSLARAEAVDDATDYRITSQDILQVAVFQVRDLDRTVRVDGGGFVSLPLIGRVPVRGRTLVQAQDDISARYAKSYLQSPQVTVSLVRSGQRVTVSGAVKNPSVLTIEGTVTLTMAIAQSGGVSEIGNSDRIHIARTTMGQEVEDQVYNLDDIQAGRSPNPVLRGGDIVVVEDSTTRLALKNVKDVMPFAALGGLFLSDVSAKRDLTPVAEENGLQLYRYRYAWSDRFYVGVLAQDVLEVAPSAVVRGADGYLRVDYVRLGLRMQPWEDWIASRAKLMNPPESP